MTSRSRDPAQALVRVSWSALRRHFTKEMMNYSVLSLLAIFTTPNFSEATRANPLRAAGIVALAMTLVLAFCMAYWRVMAVVAQRMMPPLYTLTVNRAALSIGALQVLSALALAPAAVWAWATATPAERIAIPRTVLVLVMVMTFIMFQAIFTRLALLDVNGSSGKPKATPPTSHSTTPRHTPAPSLATSARGR